jgi:hypothetical protein
MNTNKINEVGHDFFSLLLPSGTNGVLRTMLGDQPNGYVWFLDAYNKFGNTEWIQNNMPSCFGECVEERKIQVNCLHMDIVFQVKVFLKYLDRFDAWCDVIYSAKPKPYGLQIKTIPDHLKGKIFKQNQIEFYYSIPHPNEYAMVYSCKPEILEKFNNCFSHNR